MRSSFKISEVRPLRNKLQRLFFIIYIMVIYFRNPFLTRFIVAVIVILFLFNVFSEKNRAAENQKYVVRFTPSIFAAIIRQNKVNPDVVSQMYVVKVLNINN